MKIMSYVELTPAQMKSIEAFEKVVVKTSILNPTVVATFTTFQRQQVEVTIDGSGVIEHVSLG